MVLVLIFHHAAVTGRRGGEIRVCSKGEGPQSHHGGGDDMRYDWDHAMGVFNLPVDIQSKTIQTLIQINQCFAFHFLLLLKTN